MGTFNGLAGLGDFQWIEWLMVSQWMGLFGVLGVSVDWMLWVSLKGPGSLGYFSGMEASGVYERIW